MVLSINAASEQRTPASFFRPGATFSYGGEYFIVVGESSCSVPVDTASHQVLVYCFDSNTLHKWDTTALDNECHVNLTLSVG